MATTEQTYECEKCGTEFESYEVFIKDDFLSICKWVRRKEEYEHLCPDCNEEWYENHE